MTQKLSAVITVKNEEERITACLESVKWADEIIIVDNDSADKTLEICRKYTDKIYFSPSPFTGIRVNLGIQKASGEWILNIDADEVVNAELKNEITDKINDSAGRYSGFYIPVKNYFMGKWLNHGGWYPGYVKRLYKKDSARYLAADHQVQVVITGEAGHLLNPIYHYSPFNVKTFLDKTNFYTTNSSKVNFNKKRVSWFDILLRPPLIFIKRYIVLGGFLDGFPGFAIAILSGLYIFMDKTKLKELEYRSKKLI